MANILYIRSGPYELNFDNYNLQEVGLGKAFCNKGHNFDVLYYAKHNKDEIIEVNNNKLTLLWRKGIKILRTGIYPSILKKETLKKYDAIIVSEYSQFMSYLIACKHPNVYLYNGLYYNLFKIPIMQPIYDFLFCKKINQLMKKSFCKTEKAKEFISKKGIKQAVVTGVGLDTEKFDVELDIDECTTELLDKMNNHRCILYVGSISKRKNIDFLIRTFIHLKKNKNKKNIKLVLVGKGEQKYCDYCPSLIPDELTEDIVWCAFIKNAQMKYVYKKSEIFLLPSVQEIFGMVLLEAMYFDLPVISSDSAGANTLIENGVNGIIMDGFQVSEWSNSIQYILDNKDISETLGKKAGNTIRESFTWSQIASVMLEHMILS